MIESFAWLVFCAIGRSDLTSYFGAMRDLSRLIVECLTEGLGLPPNTYTKLETANAICNARVNHYPACPDPSRVFGIPAHTDPQMLSILYQDEVGGLQVQKNGKWIGVRPDDTTFVVNLGDTFQVVLFPSRPSSSCTVYAGFLNLKHSLTVTPAQF